MPINDTFKKLVAVFGDAEYECPTDVLTLATNGFTARSMKFSDEGILCNKKLELVDGFKPVDNNSTQILTLANVAVDSNSSEDFIAAIRPINSFVYSEKSSSGDLEPSFTDMAPDRMFLENAYTSKDLRITGSLSASAGNGHLSTSTGGTVTGTIASSGLTGDVTAPFAPGDSFGSWVVETTIPAVYENFEAFTLMAGSLAPDDEPLQLVSDSSYFDFSDLVDIDGKFKFDFHVDSRFSIVKSITSSDICFHKGSNIPTNVMIFIGPYTEGTFDMTDSQYNLFYEYGHVPKYEIHFAPGSIIMNVVPVNQGFCLPPGFLVPEGSSVEALYGTVVDNLLLTDLIADSGFVINGGMILYNPVSQGTRKNTPAGLTISEYQKAKVGMKTSENLSLPNVIFGEDSKLPSDLMVNSEVYVTDDFTTGRGTVFMGGSTIKAGSLSLEGATMADEFKIAAGSIVNDDYVIPGPFDVMSNVDNGGTAISAGTTVGAPFLLGALETELTSGNTLPATLKVSSNMNVEFLPGSEFPVDTHCSTGAHLYGNVGFRNDGEIPAQSFLSGNFTVPAKSLVEKGTTLPNPIPIPDGTVLVMDSSLCKGVIFAGTNLPNLDLSQHSGSVYSGTGPVTTSPISMFVDVDGIARYVIKGGTTYRAGFKFPIDSIMSKNVEHGVTNSIGTDEFGAAYSSGLAVSKTLDEGDYSSTGLGEYSSDEVVIVPGVPTEKNIYLLTNMTSDYDFVIKVSDFDPKNVEFLVPNDDFVLLENIVLSEDYTVSGVSSVQFPAGKSTPKDFVLTVPHNFTTTGFTLNKAIKFDVTTSDDYITGIVGEGNTNYIRLPSNYTFTHSIRLALTQSISTSGTNSLKSTIDLPIGTKLNVSDPVKLIVNMAVTQDWVVLEDLVTYSAFTAETGMKFIEGGSVPGDIIVKSGQPLAKDIVLTEDITLLNDHVVREKLYLVKAGTRCTSGCTFVRGTEFYEPTSFDDVVFAPILSLGSNNLFDIPEGTLLDTDVGVPYLYDTVLNRVDHLQTDARNLILKLLILQNVVDGLVLNV